MNKNSRQYKDMQYRKTMIDGMEVTEMPPIKKDSWKNGIWAMLHIQGRNPEECTCDDCADKHTGHCSDKGSPVRCNIMNKDMTFEVIGD